jgi:nucleoside-diphosphate-sugar epimerase
LKRLLLTGASGFIGQALLEQLDPAEWEIIATGSRPPSPALLARVKSWVVADLLDPEQRRALIEQARASHWVHLAWFTSHGEFWHSGRNLAWTAASLEMLEAFRETGGKHVVMAGTCAEYDWRHGFCSEDLTPLLPHSLYGTAKDSLRRSAEAYCAARDVRFAWGRVFSPFGPREGRQRFIPSVIRDMQAGRPVRCSHGLQYRDFLPVSDLAQGFRRLLESGVSGSYNIASSTPTQLREIVRHLAEITGWRGSPEFGAIPVAADDPPLLIGDNRKLRAIGWQPETGLTTALARTAAWWQANEDPTY